MNSALAVRPLRAALVSALLLLAPCLVFDPTSAGAQLSGPPDYVRRQFSPALDFGSGVDRYRVDARGEWVVFLGDVEFDDLWAIYSIRRHGSQLHRLSPYGPLEAFRQFEIAPGAPRVVYSAALESPGLFEIWSAPLSGGPASAVKISVPLAGSGAGTFQMPKSGTRLAYGGPTDDGFGIWSVPFAGPATASVSLLGAGMGPGRVALSPDGSRVLLVEGEAIWSIPVAGPASAAVEVTTEAPGCIFNDTYFPAGSTRFVYALFCYELGIPMWKEIRSVPFTGPVAATLTLADGFVSGGEVVRFAVSPDGERVVFLADRTQNDRFELWSAPVDGPAGEPVRLNPPLAPGAEVTRFAIAPDSSRVVYVADSSIVGVYGAWSVPIAGPSEEAQSLVSGIVALGGDVVDARFTPDSATVVLHGDLTLDGRYDLYSVPADGSATQNRITNDNTIPRPELSVVGSWRIHPVGGRITFVFDEDETPGTPGGLGEQRISPEYNQDARLNVEPAQEDGAVRDFELFPGGTGAIYRSDELGPGYDSLLIVVDTRIFGDGFEEGTTSAWADLP